MFECNEKQIYPLLNSIIIFSFHLLLHNDILSDFMSKTIIDVIQNDPNFY